MKSVSGLALACVLLLAGECLGVSGRFWRRDVGVPANSSPLSFPRHVLGRGRAPRGGAVSGGIFQSAPRGGKRCSGLRLPCPGLAWPGHLRGWGGWGREPRGSCAVTGGGGGWEGASPCPFPMSPVGLNSPGESPRDSRGRAEPEDVGRDKRRSWAVRSVRVGLRALVSLFFPVSVRADEVDVDGTLDDDLGKSREGSRTDDEVVQRWVPGAPWFWKGQFEHQ